MTASNNQVLIIGGGFAGIAAAVFLDSAGFKITLLEKKPILGGRTYAFQDRKTSDWIDNGQHLLMGAYHETLRLIENLGATRHLKNSPKTVVPLVTEDNRKTSFTSSRLPPPWNFLLPLLRLKSLKARDKFRLLRLGREILRWRQDPSSVSLDKNVSEWLQDMGQSSYARKNFWDLLTLATLNDDPSVASAKMLVVVLAKGFLGGKNDRRILIPKGTLNDLLATPARAYLELRGHKLVTGQSAKRIDILDNRVCGIELADGSQLKGDWYVSAVPFRPLLNLVPEPYSASLPYFGEIRKLKSSPIVSINLWFDREIFSEELVGVAGRTIHWYFNKNRNSGREGPPFHVVGVVSGAYSMIESSREEIVAITLSELNEIFPAVRGAKLVHSLVNKEREATLSPTVESEKYRPAQQSPFPNFFVIGDWTKTGLPATIESAVLSARLAADEMEKSLGQTRPRSRRPVPRSHLQG